MTCYQHSTCLSFRTDGEDEYCEIDVSITYRVLAGRAETPPSYSHGGLPAEAAEIDDVIVEAVNGLPASWCSDTTLAAIEDRFASGDFDADLITGANEQEQYRREEAVDHRREY